jgi:hypothetical protein
MEKVPVPFEVEPGYAYVDFWEEKSLVPFGNRSPHRPAHSFNDYAALAAPTSELPLVPAVIFWLI